MLSPKHLIARVLDRNYTSVQNKSLGPVDLKFISATFKTETNLSNFFTYNVFKNTLSKNKVYNNVFLLCLLNNIVNWVGLLHNVSVPCLRCHFLPYLPLPMPCLHLPMPCLHLPMPCIHI